MKESKSIGKYVHGILELVREWRTESTQYLRYLRSTDVLMETV